MASRESNDWRFHCGQWWLLIVQKCSVREWQAPRREFDFLGCAKEFGMCGKGSRVRKQCIVHLHRQAKFPRIIVRRYQKGLIARTQWHCRRTKARWHVLQKIKKKNRRICLIRKPGSLKSRWRSVMARTKRWYDISEISSARKHELELQYFHIFEDGKDFLKVKNDEMCGTAAVVYDLEVWEGGRLPRFTVVSRRIWTSKPVALQKLRDFGGRRRGEFRIACPREMSCKVRKRLTSRLLRTLRTCGWDDRRGASSCSCSLLEGLVTLCAWMGNGGWCRKMQRATQWSWTLVYLGFVVRWNGRRWRFLRWRCWSSRIRRSRRYLSSKSLSKVRPREPCSLEWTSSENDDCSAG